MYDGRLIDLILSLNKVTKVTLIGFILTISLREDYLGCLNDVYSIATTKKLQNDANQAIDLSGLS